MDKYIQRIISNEEDEYWTKFPFQKNEKYKGKSVTATKSIYLPTGEKVKNMLNFPTETVIEFKNGKRARVSNRQLKSIR